MYASTGGESHGKRRAADLPVLIALFVVMGLCAGLVLASRGLLFAPPDEPQGQDVTHGLHFAGTQLRVRDTWLVARNQLPGQARLSLRIPLSDIPGTLANETAAVTIALSPIDDALPPAERPRVLYSRFLSAEASAVPGNLVRRPFRADSPYGGEVLLLAPPEGRHFSARCDERGDSLVEPTCLAEIRRAGLDVQIQLSKRDIAQWERIAAWIAATLIVTGTEPGPTDTRRPQAPPG